MFSFFNIVKSVNVPKTLWFNIKVFPLKSALKLPIIIRKNVEILHVGEIVISSSISRGMMVLGGGRY